MELCGAFHRLAVTVSRRSGRCLSRRPIRAPHSRRAFASVSEPQGQPDAELPIIPASEIDLSTFEPSRTKALDPINPRKIDQFALRRLRIVPKSPAYFTTTPQFIDDYILLTALMRKYATLPTLTPSEVPQSSWVTIDGYRDRYSEPVKSNLFKKMIAMCQRLNLIMPEVMPQEVLDTLNKLRKIVDRSLNQAKPIFMDEFGRTKAHGRRKTSSASVYLVEGDGQVMVNGKSLAEAFARVIDREAAVWALKATGRLDKYNVFGLVAGGGTTGQAEALTLAVARALMAHEPALKPALRRAGVLHRDPRMVERKKPGRVKARKMPTWVKR